MTLTTGDIGARLDHAFDTFARVCIAVTVPFAEERRWEGTVSSLGLYAEQTESDPEAETITYYYRPNYDDHMLNSLFQAATYLRVTALRLPDTERGRQIQAYGPSRESGRPYFLRRLQDEGRFIPLENA